MISENMEKEIFALDAVSIVLYVVIALLIIVPTLGRIYRNKNLSNNQKYIYTALTVLLPPIGLLLYYMKSQSDLKNRYNTTKEE